MGNNFIPLALLYLCFHFILLTQNTREYLYILTICTIGVLVDSLLQYFSFFSFVAEKHLPYWLIVLWICFSTTLCHSLKFIGSSIWFQIIAGLIAPFSYLAGNALDAVQFGQSLLLTYFFLALIWTLLFILFFSLKLHFVDKEYGYG